MSSGGVRPAEVAAPLDPLRWMHDGTGLFLRELRECTDAELAGPTALPGWTGRHLAAHVAGNARALSRLAHWARTGVETPMYTSPQQREADIAAGAAQPAARLRADVADTADRLDDDLASLDGEGWARPVRTAQGRTVPATQIPWLRAREVMVHAVDLAGRDFAGLPTDFLAALVDDIATKRSGAPGPALLLRADDRSRPWAVGEEGAAGTVEVHGRLADLAAWLAGRSGFPPVVAGGTLPVLAPWL